LRVDGGASAEEPDRTGHHLEELRADPFHELLDIPAPYDQRDRLINVPLRLRIELITDGNRLSGTKERRVFRVRLRKLYRPEAGLSAV